MEDLIELFNLGPVGVVVGLILLIQTSIAVYFATRSKYYAAAYRWRKRMEPIHLDLLEWAYQVQVQAIKQGRRKDLPPLPVSLQEGWVGDPELDSELLVLKRMERRHETQQAPDPLGD